MISFYMWNLRKQTHRNREQNGGWGWGKWGDVGQNLQTSDSKMNKFQGFKVQCGNYS